MNMEEAVREMARQHGIEIVDATVCSDCQPQDTACAACVDVQEEAAAAEADAETNARYMAGVEGYDYAAPHPTFPAPAFDRIYKAAIAANERMADQGVNNVSAPQPQNTAGASSIYERDANPRRFESEEDKTFYVPSPRVGEQIERVFQIRPLVNKGEKHQRLNEVVAKFRSVAAYLVQLTPECREQSLMLTHLEEAANNACNAIARDV